MLHDNELWQEYDYNGERIGQGLEPRRYADGEVKIFGGVAIMLYRFRNGEVEFLFQQRGHNIIGNPDKWDVSAGGHINYQEPCIDAALREANEEIGAKLTKEAIEFDSTFLRGNVLIYLYYFDWTNLPDEFKFNDHEVQDVKWVPYSKLPEFWPELKPELRDDEILRQSLAYRVEKALQKYGNH